jgi:CRP/FNR family transcriptional regulator, cyclic AMP receptor protein
LIDHDFIRSSDEIIKQLLRIPALKSVDGRDLKDLVDASRIGTYQSGEVIFEEGSTGKMIFYLISGRVKIIKDGHELLTLHRTGDVFGEMGPIGGKTRSASIEALCDVSCVEIDLSVIDKQKLPDTDAFRYLIFRGFAEIIASHLQHTTEQMLSLRDELAQLKKMTRPN